MRRQVQGVAGLADHGLLGLVEVAVGAPMTMPIWMTARASAGFFFALAISWSTLTLPKAKSAVSLFRLSSKRRRRSSAGKFCSTSLVAISWATRWRSEGSTVPSAAATSAHIAMLASRNAPLFRSFFFATNWVCICDADSLMRSHRAMLAPRIRGGAPHDTPPATSTTP